MKASIGRIVHVVIGDEHSGCDEKCFAGLVVGIDDPEVLLLINVRVFGDEDPPSGDLYLRHAPLDEEGKRHNTWHWPARV